MRALPLHVSRHALPPATELLRNLTLQFEGARRHKEPLGEEQRSFIQEYADHDAEAWVLERIEEQWREPGLYVEESEEAKRFAGGDGSQGLAAKGAPREAPRAEPKGG